MPRAHLATTIFRVMVVMALPSGCDRHALDQGDAGAAGGAGGSAGGTSGGTGPAGGTSGGAGLAGGTSGGAGLAGGTSGGATAGSPGGSSGGSPAPDGGVPTSPLEAAIQGWWSLGMNIGNCIQSESYYHFVSAGVAESVLVDDNACYPAMRGIFRTPETYQLAGTTLTLTDARKNMTRQQYDVAVGTVGTSTTRNLFHRIFKPVDAVTWHAASVTDAYDPNGALTSHHTVTVDLRFAAALPARGQGNCVVDVSYMVDGLTGSSRATACTYAPAGDIQRIEFVGYNFDPLLGGTTLSQVLTLFGQSLYLNPTDPTYLYMSAWPGLAATPPRL